MKSKLVIGKILTSLLFLLLISNFTFAGFSRLNGIQSDNSVSDDDKAAYFCNDDDAESLNVDFTPEKDGLEESVEPFLNWIIHVSDFNFLFEPLFTEEAVVYYYDSPDFYQDIPIWIFTRKILL